MNVLVLTYSAPRLHPEFLTYLAKNHSKAIITAESYSRYGTEKNIEWEELKELAKEVKSGNAVLYVEKMFGQIDLTFGLFLKKAIGYAIPYYSFEAMVVDGELKSINIIANFC